MFVPDPDKFKHACNCFGTQSQMEGDMDFHEMEITPFCKNRIPEMALMLDALGNMWTQEYGELELEIHQTLTEPTCPMAFVKTEVEDGPFFRYDADTIEEAKFGALKAAYITLVLRKPKPMSCPIDDINADERVAKFLAALDARWAGPKSPTQ